jgi:hypothetical protein
VPYRVAPTSKTTRVTIFRGGWSGLITAGVLIAVAAIFPFVWGQPAAAAIALVPAGLTACWYRRGVIRLELSERGIGVETRKHRRHYRWPERVDVKRVRNFDPRKRKPFLAIVARYADASVVLLGRARAEFDATIAYSAALTAGAAEHANVKYLPCADSPLRRDVGAPGRGTSTSTRTPTEPVRRVPPAQTAALGGIVGFTVSAVFLPSADARFLLACAAATAAASLTSLAVGRLFHGLPRKAVFLLLLGITAVFAAVVAQWLILSVR